MPILVQDKPTLLSVRPARSAIRQLKLLDRKKIIFVEDMLLIMAINDWWNTGRDTVYSSHCSSHSTPEASCRQQLRYPAMSALLFVCLSLWCATSTTACWRRSECSVTSRVDSGKHGYFYVGLYAICLWSPICMYELLDIKLPDFRGHLQIKSN